MRIELNGIGILTVVVMGHEKMRLVWECTISPDPLG